MYMQLTRSTPCLASSFQVGSQTRRGTGQLTCALTCIICMYLYVAPEDGCILHPKHVEQKV